MGEARELAALAWPTMLAYTLSYALMFSIVVAAGRQSAAHLAGVTLGSLTTNVTGFSIIIGLLTGMDTLCSQVRQSRSTWRTETFGHHPQ